MKKIFSILLSILACLCLVACTPSNVGKAEEKMKEAGYTVTTYQKQDAEMLILAITSTGNWDKEEGIEGGLSAYKEGRGELSAILFETEADAEDLYRYLGVSNIKIEGKWIYWGDKKAIEDFTR